MNYYTIPITLLMLLSLSACNDPSSVSKTPDKEAVKTQHVQVRIEGDDIPMATVDGSVISQYDLEQASQKLLGKEAGDGVAEETRQKILESMVLSRAISQLQEKQMSPQEQAELDKVVEVYREQLLVRRYLAAKAAPEPVTMDRIQEYYDKHPELFGAETMKSFEMITTKRPLAPGERDELLTQLGAPEKRKEWQAWAGELVALGYPVVYRRVLDGGTNLHSQLKQSIASLSAGEVAPFLFIGETPYLLRVIEEKKVPAKPLTEVAGSIRKKLGPEHLKQAIDKMSKEVLESVVVEYNTKQTELTTQK